MSYSDPTRSSHPNAVTCFSVLTEAEPTTLARVLEVFALREVMPAHFHSVLDAAPDDHAASHCLNVDIQVADLSPDAAAAIARKLGAVVGVRAVLTREQAMGND